MDLELDKILKSAEYVFDGIKDAEQAIDYIRVLVDKFHQRDSKNALVQIHAPDMVMISQRDLDELTALRASYDDLKTSYAALSKNYDELEERYDDQRQTMQSVASDLLAKNADLTTEIEHLKKSRGMCQLDSAGVCTYCDKRVVLAKDLTNALCRSEKP